MNPPASSVKKTPGPALVPPDEGIGRSLPHAREFERFVLGAVVLDNAILEEVANALRAEDFFCADHRMIYSQMLKMSERGIPIEPVLLMDELTKSSQLESAGGAAYLSELAAGQPRVKSALHYARIVKEKAVMRQAALTADALRERALEPDAGPSDLVDYLETLFAVVQMRPPQEETLQIPDMPEAALDGRLGEICQQRLSGLPVSYAWVALVTVAGTAVPQTPHVRTNIFGCLLGAPGTGKSQAIERAISTMGVTKPQLEATLAGSAEGLLDKLSDANGDARLLSPDELGHLLAKARIDGASFPYVLNSAYYRNEFDVTAARGKKIHVNCSLGIVGGIVEENYEQSFGSATTGGLHDRFIFGQCPRPFEYHYRPFEGSKEETQPCSVTVAGDVWEARDEWVKHFPGLSTRCAEHAIRVAIIAAAFSGRLVLLAKHLGPARAFAEYQARIRKMFKPNPGENTDAKCAFAILAILEQNPGWNLKRAVARKIHSERYGPTAFERAIKALQSSGDIDKDAQKPVRIRRVG